MKEKYIELSTIETSEAAKNFAKLLKENRTYFLNGSWGSGKTTFLKNVEQYTPKELVYLDLWKLQEKINIMEFTYQKMRPIVYLLINVIFILFTGLATVVTTIFGRIVVNLSNGDNIFGNIFNIKINTGWDLFPYILSITFLLGILQYVRDRINLVYYYLLNKIKFKNKILVIDDFDRILPETQKEAYKLFSHLKGKLPIIFVGDFIKINSMEEENFLSKIIDRRYELPYDLHPRNIWNRYFLEIEIKYGVYISDDFKKRVINDGRNLRDREHFNDYVNREFIDNGKIGSVQVEQQLLVIYVYLFDVEKYKKLLNEEKIIKDTTSSIELDMKYRGKLELLLHQLQTKDNGKYPGSFKRRSKNYYIYEVPSNRKINELDEILNNDILFKEELVKSEIRTDFYQYILSNYYDFEQKQQDRLVELSLDTVLDKNFNKELTSELDLIRYIFRQKSTEFRSESQENTESTFYTRWIDYLETRGLDISEKLHFLQRYTEFSIYDLGLNSNGDITEEVVRPLKRKDMYLTVYLSSNKLFEKYEEWTEKEWNIVNVLEDEEFIRFWTLQGILSNQISREFYEYIPENKKYLIVEERKILGADSEQVVSNKAVIEKLNPRLLKLEDKGYKFEYIKKLN